MHWSLICLSWIETSGSFIDWIDSTWLQLRFLHLSPVLPGNGETDCFLLIVYVTWTMNLKGWSMHSFVIAGPCYIWKGLLIINEGRLVLTCPFVFQQCCIIYTQYIWLIYCLYYYMHACLFIPSWISKQLFIWIIVWRFIYWLCCVVQRCGDTRGEGTSGS